LLAVASSFTREASDEVHSSRGELSYSPLQAMNVSSGRIQFFTNFHLITWF
jgi:hypothetical protein